MGAEQSTLDGKGYHVLRVAKSSPADQANLNPFFDFIVGINGQKLDLDTHTLTNLISENENKQTKLQVYSNKEQDLREVILTPNHNWSTDPKGGLIGCAVRYCSYEASAENVYHILQVAPNSPAESAGLVPFKDYIIGSPHTVLRKETDLYELVEQHMDQPLRLYVYNSDYDTTREVIIMPNHEWGGEGSLGCGVGFGYLHRIPKRNRSEEEKQDVENNENQNQVEDGKGVNISNMNGNHNNVQNNNDILPNQELKSIPEGPTLEVKKEEKILEEKILDSIEKSERPILSLSTSPGLFVTTADGETSPLRGESPSPSPPHNPK